MVVERARQAIVNLFDLSPLYAFSVLTSKTAVGFLILNYIWVTTAPAVLITTSMAIVITIFFAVVSIVTFVWPLLGVHGQWGQEKQRLLRESFQRLEATIAELHGRVDAGELHSINELHFAMNSLELEQSVLTRIPTWPWRPGTLRGFATALLLPLVLFFLQFFLQCFLAQ